MGESTVYYTLEEIKPHTGLNGTTCWLIYKNIVYDVTEYIDEHPGGAELVTEYGGRDCTKPFEDAGHSGDARAMFKPYKIGELALEDRKQKSGNKSTKDPGTNVRRSCISIVSCGLLG